MTTKNQNSASPEKASEPELKTKNYDFDIGPNAISNWMPDRALQKIVAANLGRELDQVTKEDLANLTEINLIAKSETTIVQGRKQYVISPREYQSRLKLKSLAGLEYATNLVKLNLAPDRQLNHEWLHRTFSRSSLIDISALQNLTKLARVNLEMCSIADISALANKPQLMQLNLSYNAISDFSPLKANKQLLASGSIELKKQIIIAEPVHITAGTFSYTSGPYQLLDLNGASMPIKIETGKHIGARCNIKQYCSNWDEHVGQVNGKQTVTWDLTNLKPDSNAAMTIKFHSNSATQKPLISGWYVIPFRIVSGQPITFHFKDDADNTIACEQKLYGDINNSCTAPVPTFNGYSIEAKLVNGVKTPLNQGSLTTTITAQPQDIFLLYNRNKAADITVHYQDENGKTIAPATMISGVFSEQKIVKPQEISGYTPSRYQIDHNGISHHPGSVAILLNNQPQEITFYYNRQKVSNVIVHYQDIEGQKVAPDEILSGYVNDQQMVHTLKLPGYTIQSKNLNGLSTKSELNTTAITLKEKPQKLTYIYTKDIIGNKKVANNKPLPKYKNRSYHHLTNKIKTLNNRKKKAQQSHTKAKKKWQFLLLILGLASLFSILGLTLIYYNKKNRK